jgi:ssDNA-binding Zn-finger/Zn-ribbon topoisomerase 1
MFIIFGTRGRLTNASPSEVLHGSCPGCRGDLVLKENKTWFTLFFMPIFPITSKGKFYQCNRCEGAYKSEAREYLVKPT